MVMDHYGTRFPRNPWEIEIPAPDATPATQTITTVGTLFNPDLAAEVARLRKLIDEFREAVEAAKKIDVLTKQPDCEDPEKAKLLDRVAELERRLDQLEKSKRRRNPRFK